jgi:hypothetical protein
LPVDAKNHAIGIIASDGIGAKKLSINIAKATPGYQIVETKLSKKSTID